MGTLNEDGAQSSGVRMRGLRLRELTAELGRGPSEALPWAMAAWGREGCSASQLPLSAFATWLTTLKSAAVPTNAKEAIVWATPSVTFTASRTRFALDLCKHKCLVTLLASIKCY